MAAGLAVLVISALAITTIVGLRNSQLSQNQIQATKLAQAGIEEVRSIRSRDQSVCLAPNTPLPWDDIYGQNFSRSEFRLNGNGCTGATGSYLVYTGDGTPDLAPTSQLPFTRRIYLEKTSSTEIMVTVTVDWNDYSGPHQSKLITILSNQ